MRRDATVQRVVSWKQKPLVEAVEQRLLLATYTVKSIADSASATAGDGTLRGEILQLNATGAASGNTINFSLPTGVQTIAVSTPLPTITVPVTIDGNTQAGYSGTPLIVLSGAGAGTNADGLDIAAGKSTVRGLVINGFSGEGIALSVAGNNTITGDYIGTDAMGTVAVANKLDGIVVLVNSNNNIITNNLISGNTANGIYLNGTKFAATNPVTSSNTIAGNKIGVDVSGAKGLGNGNDGIYVANAPNSIIGGTGGAATRNIISGNKNGLELYDNSDNTVIEGNYIGTDATGTVALSNSTSGVITGSGIVLRGISNSTIGGLTPSAANVISANLNYGIDSFVIGSGNLNIEGNLIGTDATGTKALGNTRAGVYIAGESNVTIGGTTAGAGNVISGNVGDGINMFANAAGLLIEGNKIGTAIDGTTALGNGGAGVAVSVSGVVVGGTAPGAGNIIANNGATATFNHSGVIVSGGTKNVPILNNSIYNNKLAGIEDQNNPSNQAAPVLTSAVSAGNTSTIAGSLTTSNGTYLVQFFSTPTLDPAGKAEGKTLLGSTTVTVTNGTQTLTGSLTAGFDAGSYITATATNVTSGTPTNTSPFSGSLISTGTGPDNQPPTFAVSAPSSSAAGDTVTEVFTINNASPLDDNGVVFVDPVPTGTTFVSGTSSTGVPVTVSNGVITAAIGTLTANTSVTVTVLLTVQASAVPSFTNTAHVTATTPALTAGQDAISATTAVTPLTDVSVAVAGPSGPTPAGSNVVFLVNVDNKGPSAATDVLLVDTLPAGVTLVSATSSDGTKVNLTSNGLAETIATLAAGGRVTLTIAVATNVSTPATINDTATATATEADANSANNAGLATAAVAPAADLGVSNDPPPASVFAGATVALTAHVSNNGPSTATGVVLTFNLPAGLTFVSGTADGGTVVATNGVVTAPVGTLANGGLSSVTILVRATTDGTPLVTESVASQQLDPVSGNNTGQINLTALPINDLAVQLFSPTGPALIDQPLTYTAIVTNAGPSAATGVTFYSSLFAGATFQSSQVAGLGVGSVSNGTISAPIGTVAAGQSVIVTVTILPGQAGTFAIAGAVAEAQTDTNPANNTASAAVTVLPESDLFVSYSSKPGTATIGLPLSYTAVVTNSGPSTDTDVALTSPLFAGASLLLASVAGQISGSVSNGTITVPIGTLGAGQSVTVTLTVLPTQTGTFNTAVSVVGDAPDTNIANNTAYASIVLSGLTTPSPPTPTVEFSAATYTVDKSAGTATITFNRVGDLSQATSAIFSTSGGTATAGRDYTPTTQVVTFAPSVSSASVTIPILATPSGSASSTVTLTLSDPTNATFDGNAATASALLQITNPSPVLFGPTIPEVKLIGPATGITSIEIDFSKAIDPIPAVNIANYSLIASPSAAKGSLAGGTVVPVTAASYNPTTNAVLLIPATPLPANQFFQIDVNGSRAGAITDLAGNPLYSSVTTAAPGSDYLLSFARGNNLQFTDQNGTAIHLKLNGPGVVDVDQTASGLVGRIQLLGISKSTLTGSATRSTDLGVVGLLGRFKKTLSNLPRPYHSVGTFTFTPPIQAVRIAAVDTLTTSPPTKKGKSKTVVSTHATALAARAATTTPDHPRGMVAAQRHPKR